MHNLFLASILFLTPAAAVLAAGPGSTSPTDTIEIKSKELAAPQLATILRTMVGPIQVEVPSAHTVKVTGSTATLELCQQVAALIDGGTAGNHIDLPDGTQIVAVRLMRAAGSEALVTLRQALAPAKLAGSANPALVVMRDTPERIEQARALLERLDRPVA